MTCPPLPPPLLFFISSSQLRNSVSFFLRHSILYLPPVTVSRGGLQCSKTLNPFRSIPFSMTWDRRRASQLCFLLPTNNYHLIQFFGSMPYLFFFPLFFFLLVLLSLSTCYRSPFGYTNKREGEKHRLQSTESSHYHHPHPPDPFFLLSSSHSQLLYKMLSTFKSAFFCLFYLACPPPFFFVNCF